MSEIKIRLARIGDIQQIATIHVTGWQQAYRGQMPEEVLDNLSIPQRETRWSEILGQPKVGDKNWVAQEDNEILGFCSTGVSRDKDASKDVGEVYALYVKPAELGSGIGTLLLVKAQEDLKAQGYRQATLWVLKTNDQGRSFYEKRGWHADGATKTDDHSYNLEEVRYQRYLG